MRISDWSSDVCSSDLDRIGVINKGELVVVEDKDVLMRKLGKKQLTLSLQVPLERIPDDLSGLPLELSDDGQSLVYTFDTQPEETGIAEQNGRVSCRERVCQYV